MRLLLGASAIAAFLLLGSAAAAYAGDGSDALAPSDTIVVDPVSGSTDPAGSTTTITDPVLDTTSGAADPVLDIAAPVTDRVLDTTSGAADPVLDVVEPVTDLVLDVVEPVTDPVLDVVEPALQMLPGAAETEAAVAWPAVSTTVASGAASADAEPAQTLAARSGAAGPDAWRLGLPAGPGFPAVPIDLPAGSARAGPSLTLGAWIALFGAGLLSLLLHPARRLMSPVPILRGRSLLPAVPPA